MIVSHVFFCDFLYFIDFGCTYHFRERLCTHDCKVQSMVKERVLSSELVRCTHTHTHTHTHFQWSMHVTQQASKQMAKEERKSRKQQQKEERKSKSNRASAAAASTGARDDEAWALKSYSPRASQLAQDKSTAMGATTTAIEMHADFPHDDIEEVTGEEHHGGDAGIATAHPQVLHVVSSAGVHADFPHDDNRVGDAGTAVITPTAAGTPAPRPTVPIAQALSSLESAPPAPVDAATSSAGSSGDDDDDVDVDMTTRVGHDTDTHGSDKGDSTEAAARAAHSAEVLPAASSAPPRPPRRDESDVLVLGITVVSCSGLIPAKPGARTVSA